MRRSTLKIHTDGGRVAGGGWREHSKYPKGQRGGSAYNAHTRTHKHTQAT